MKTPRASRTAEGSAGSIPSVTKLTQRQPAMCLRTCRLIGRGAVHVSQSFRPPRIGEFACAILIDTKGCFLLQQRDDISGILCPGRTGLFGGHREGNESYLQCVVREIYEEIGYFVAAKRFRHLGTYDRIAHGSGAVAHGEIFVA